MEPFEQAFAEMSPEQRRRVEIFERYDTEWGPVREARNAEELLARVQAETGVELEVIGGSDEARTYSAATRTEASALMRKVEQFYRTTEPSSPIPLLVERARNFVAKDFASLLKEMAKKDENN